MKLAEWFRKFKVGMGKGVYEKEGRLFPDRVLEIRRDWRFAGKLEIRRDWRFVGKLENHRERGESPGKRRAPPTL